MPRSEESITHRLETLASPTILAPVSQWAQATLIVRSFAALYFGGLKPAFHESWKWMGGVSTALGILIPLIHDLAKPQPKWEARMITLLWQIPLTTGLVFFGFMFLFYIPFSKYQRLKKSSEDTERQFHTDLERLDTKHAEELAEATNKQNNYFYNEVLPEETDKLKAKYEPEIAALTEHCNTLEKKIYNQQTEWENREHRIIEVSHLRGVGKLFEVDSLRKQLIEHSGEINGKGALKIILEDWRASIKQETKRDVPEPPDLNLMTDAQLKQWIVDRDSELRELIPKSPSPHK